MFFFHKYAFIINLILYNYNIVGKKFVTEALYFHSLKAQQIISIPQTIQNTPRKSGQKVLFYFDEFNLAIQFYDLFLLGYSSVQ